ncbi:MAG: cupin domain-containing protein [Acidobacteriota bacterium]|nr:cupin domain-containing protein [Acidobacteriota bacterium]
MKKLATAVCSVLLVFTICAMLVWASPAVGVTPTLIGRATYEPFKVKTAPEALVDFEAKAKSHLDMVVRTHDYAVGGSTGWHTHPGPVFISVIQGEVTFYEADDPTCTPHVVRAGHGYVDTGSGHLGRNESGQPAKDVAVIMAPVNLPFRGELPAPNPYCGF